MPASVAHLLLPTIVAVSILLMLVRPRGLPEVYWVGSGALLLIVLGLIPLASAGHAVLEGLDVYLFLTGMMLLSELAREAGVFDWVATIAVRSARGSSTRLFTLIYGVGTVVTILMSNDATAVVLTPAVLSATRKAKADKPLPYLFACALIANAASFVLPLSNPANLVVFRTGMPPLPHWLAAFTLPSLLSIAATYLVLRLYFRAELRAPVEGDCALSPLTSEGKLVLGGILLLLGVLLTTSTLGKDLGLPTCITALLVTAGVCLKSRTSPLKLIREISWAVLPLVAALFILVEAVNGMGALEFTTEALRQAEQLPPALGALVTGSVVAVANNLVNNLPLGLIAGSTLTATHSTGLLANAVLIGVDLGPNLSVTGSLATILWLGALRREKLDVGFGDFLKLGALVMPIALVLALGGAILMSFLLPTP